MRIVSWKRDHQKLAMSHVSFNANLEVKIASFFETVKKIHHTIILSQASYCQICFFQKCTNEYQTHPLVPLITINLILYSYNLFEGLQNRDSDYTTKYLFSLLSWIFCLQKWNKVEPCASIPEFSYEMIYIMYRSYF